LASADEDQVFLSVITLAELRYGIERLAMSRRRTRLDDWLKNELTVRFEGRVLSIDAGVADNWGKLVARRQAAGRPLGAMDAWIAATAEAHAMTLVTRNISDFRGSLERVINPWTAGEAPGQ
jgi:predicted nucleic acid-binding protein